MGKWIAWRLFDLAGGTALAAAYVATRFPTLGAAAVAWVWLWSKVGDAKRAAGYVVAAWAAGWALTLIILCRLVYGEWPRRGVLIESADSIIDSLSRRRRVLRGHARLFDHAGLRDTRNKNRLVPLRRDRAWVTPAGNVRLILPAGHYGLDQSRVTAGALELRHQLDCEAFVRPWSSSDSPWWWRWEKRLRPGSDYEVELVFNDVLAREVRVWDIPAPPARRSDEAAQVTIAVEATSAGVLIDVDKPWLIVGETRSGKSVMIRAAIDQLRRYVVHVETWVIDPKGGMEFGRFGRNLPAHQYANTPERIVELLREFLHQAQERSRALAEQGLEKLVEFTPKMPLMVLIVDEALLVFNAKNLGLDPKVAKPAEVESIIRQIATTYPAAGVLLVAASQSAREEDLGSLKAFFPQRTVMRVTSEHTVRATIGDQWADAPAWRFSFADAGMAFHLKDGSSVVRCKGPNVRRHEREIIDRGALVSLRVPSQRVPDEVVFLYRLYGRVRMFPGGPVVRTGLLYVGITDDPGRRLAQHREDRWWGADIERQEVAEVVYPSRGLAETAEALAIRAELPPHNRKHNPDGPHRSRDVVGVAA